MFHLHDDYPEGEHEHDGTVHRHVVRVDGTSVVEVGDCCYKQPKRPPAPDADTVTLDVHSTVVTTTSKIRSPN